MFSVQCSRVSFSSSPPDWKRWVSMFTSNDNMQEELETSYKSKIQTRWLRDNHTYDDLRLYPPTFLEANWFLIKYQIHEIVKLQQIERCVVDSCITWNRAWMVKAQEAPSPRHFSIPMMLSLSLYSSCTIWELSVTHTHTESHAPEMRHTTYARMSMWNRLRCKVWWQRARWMLYHAMFKQIDFEQSFIYFHVLIWRK